MNLPFSLFLALKYLRPKRSFVSVVTIISILGVVLGVAILIIVLSVMTGFDSMWRDRILSFKPHLTVTARRGIIADEELICQRLEAMEGIKGAAAVVRTLVLMEKDGRVAAPIVIGVSPERADRVSQIASNTPHGEFNISGDRVVIGIDLALSLLARPGESVLVYSSRNVLRKDEIYLPEELEVAGVFNMGMRDYDSRFVLTSLDVARDLTGMDEGAESIYVMTDDPFAFADAAKRVQQELGSDFSVRTWKEEDSLLFAALSHEKGMMFALLVFITVVAVFCVANTLIVITVNKSNEIGLLKALGFPPGRIMNVFVWHGWIQGALGTLLGILLGIAISANLNSIVEMLARLNVSVFPKEIYGVDEFPSEIVVSDVVFVAAAVLILTTLASLLSSWRAARMDPVKALRHE